MARVRAILAALATAVRRDSKTVGSFSGNNVFVVGRAFLFLGAPGMFGALAAFIGMILFIPLSADPLRVLPRDRLTVWPLSISEHRALRILSVWLSPVTWLIVALAAWKRVSMGLCAVAAGLFAIGFVLPSLPPARNEVWQSLPTFPGRLNLLIRKNLREALSTLDFWCGAVVSLLCLGFRAAGLLPAEGLLPMTIAVILALSTYTQTLYGLLPIPGWQILAAKDVPFILLCVLMTAPLAPGPGLAAALAALVTGHHASVTHHGKQVHWRFSSGVSFAMSIFQVALI